MRCVRSPRLSSPAQTVFTVRIPESASNDRSWATSVPLLVCHQSRREESGHHAVSTRAVPHEHAAGREHPRELREHATVVGRFGEETERCEQIQNDVEPTGPRRRQRPHVAAAIAQPRRHPALARAAPGDRPSSRSRRRRSLLRRASGRGAPVRTGRREFARPTARRARRRDVATSSRSRSGENNGSYSSRYCASK